MGWQQSSGWQTHGWRGAAASTQDAATTAWVNAVVTAGGSVSTTQKGRVDTLITALKSAGAFATLKRLWLFAGESDAHQAAIDIVNLSSNSIIGSETLSAGGYTGDGSTGAINTNYNPNTDGLSTSASIMGVYFNTNDPLGGSTALDGFGCTDSGGAVYVEFQFNNTGVIYHEICGSAFPSYSYPSQATTGAWTLAATGASSQALYKNGASVNTGSRSGSYPNANIYIGGFNNNGTLGKPTTAKAAAFFIGSDSSKQSSIDSAINAYMTAWGVNVY